MKGMVYYSRKIHRILAYLTLGMVIIYALSGIILIHRTGDFMKHAVAVETVVEPNLTGDELAPALKMRFVKVIKETPTTIFFADDGQYDKATGKASYLKKEVVKPFDKFIEIHMLADKQNPGIAWMTTIFGICLFLLALTSLFMYKPSAKQFKANMVYTVIGIVVTVVLVLLV